MITLNDGGDIIAVNPAFTKILGYAESDIINTSLITLLDLPMMKQGEQKFKFLKRGGGIVTCQIVAWKYKYQQHYAIFRRC